VEVGARRAMSQNTHPSTIGARSDIVLAKRLPPKQKVFLMAPPARVGWGLGGSGTPPDAGWT
jgi:hypothetical protein